MLAYYIESGDMLIGVGFLENLLKYFIFGTSSCRFGHNCIVIKRKRLNYLRNKRNGVVVRIGFIAIFFCYNF